MYFRTKLVAQIVCGTATLMAVTCAVRSAVVHRELVASARASAQTAADDVLWELDRRLAQLATQITQPEAQAARWDFAEQRTHTAWDTLVENVVLLPGETLAVVAPTGRVIHAEGDLAGERDFLWKALFARAFVGEAGGDGIRTGVLAGGSDMLVAASIEMGLVESDASHAGTGSNANARSVRLALIAPLSRRPSLLSRRDLSVDTYAVESDDMPDDVRSAIVDLWRTDGRTDALTSHGACDIRTLADAAGRPVFVLCARADAEIGLIIPRSVRSNLLWEALVGALAVALALRFVNANVVRPLDQLQSQAARLARSEHGRLAFIAAESGPVGELTRTLDVMLKKLEADRSLFVRNARIAGMSDVSMGVVHSAGNILNSVNISTKLLMRELQTIEVCDLKALVTELQDHIEDLGTYVTEDQNGRFSIPFLAAMTEALSEVRERCLFELEAVDRGVTHVVDLIRSQEKYAIGASVIEPSDITEIVEMALQVASMTIEGAEDIIIDRAFSDLTPARIDRHRLTSVLINLFSNAIEAVLADGEHERVIEIATYPMDGERFVIEIEDTGVGIAPENLDLIFTSAFTTKAGSSGEGLHTTANACRELGIAIGAVSQGTGCGCTVKLRIPYEPPGGGDGQVARASQAANDSTRADPEAALPMVATPLALAPRGNNG